jgi:hypothetical protein
LKNETFIFSIDVDWVDDITLEWTMDLFKTSNLPLTIFATHKTEILSKFNFDYEIGIHPNFLNIIQDDHAAVIKDLMKMFPSAKGVRSHGLYEYSNLLELYKKNGLEWDSSQLLYLCKNISPYLHPSELVRLPIFWEDDDYIPLAKNWNLSELHLEQEGIKCFDFHPVHLRLNTCDPRQYAMLKGNGFNEEGFRKYSNKDDSKGIYSIFLKLVEYIKKKQIPTCKIGDICS